MSLSRFQAVETVIGRSRQDVENKEKPEGSISSFFGDHVFTDTEMKQYLSSKTYKEFKSSIGSSHKLTRDIADEVADGMRKWAIQRGATHYAHWFQPLTGRTAEKHDSFFTLDRDGSAIEEFKGDALSQQEPDGSSFPGGGLRSTFEARGYTAWDPTSPAFLLESQDGVTLCIPTIFVTYSGEALDYKLPLLKSVSLLEKSAIPVCQFFDSKVEKVITTLGWEQEFFLVDEALFNARPDLLLTGRTLLGKSAPKGQQLDDHYFGSIPERVYSFMRDLETECHKLGIPLRTRHNEVGPGQYELAPMFEEVNVSVDHNQLLMDLMDRIAVRHKLRVLLHEKPYNSVNGSGKHNNWSLSTDQGTNLLSPGKDPGKNLRFLTFFVNTIRAVHEHADLLRASVASASNDHRLGADEAPPAIISIFIGETLTKILNDIVEGAGSGSTGVQEVLDLLSKIPDLKKDNTDRNRTSPFAFTGNKFEIRMVGSTMNCAAPMTIMNTIVADQLSKFRDEVNEIHNNSSEELEEIMLGIIRRYIKESQDILFEGDGYSKEWEEEAAKRGLKNLRNTPEALKEYVTDDAIKLFSENGILSDKELIAHYEVKVENYILKVQIESRTIGEICYNHIIPAVISYQNEILENILNLKELGMEESAYETQIDVVNRISTCLSTLKDDIYNMTKTRQKAHKEDAVTAAEIYCNKVIPLMDSIRVSADRLEYLVDDNKWPLIKYRELMFLR